MKNYLIIMVLNDKKMKNEKINCKWIFLELKFGINDYNDIKMKYKIINHKELMFHLFQHTRKKTIKKRQYNFYHLSIHYDVCLFSQNIHLMHLYSFYYKLKNDLKFHL